MSLQSSLEKMLEIQRLAIELWLVENRVRILANGQHGKDLLFKVNRLLMYHREILEELGKFDDTLEQDQ